MVGSRRGGLTRKALGPAISGLLEKLRVLAEELNGGGRLWAFDRRDLMDAAAGVVEATLGSEYPGIPDVAAQRFNALAAELPLYYAAEPKLSDAEIASATQGLVLITVVMGSIDKVKKWRRRQARRAAKAPQVQGSPRPLFYAPFGVDSRVLLRAPTVQGWAVAWLADFLANPHRTRLRRCPVCGRWFVDETRNKSARRCSKKCTIAWSTAQRSQKDQDREKEAER